jgi:GT2 family glycosyltransferase
MQRTATISHTYTHKLAEPRIFRPRVAGKYLVHGDAKLLIKGVTYGTFRPDEFGEEYASDAVEQDLRLMAAHGFNTVRTYTVPTREFLDVAARYGLYVMVGLPWEQHIAFLDEPGRIRSIERRLIAGVRRCSSHPALLGYAIGNEIPASIVRYHGRRPIERHIERLYWLAKENDPSGLVTYVNYPTTEYLDLPFLDFVSFNVYLECRDRLEAYLARLQNIAGDRPLVMTEVGLDSRRNGEGKQAAVLDSQVRTIFSAGCAGAFIFAWTDEWHRGGYDIDDWDFGLTRRDRTPKMALSAVSNAFTMLPLTLPCHPKVSVVVCSFNGSRTIRDCLEALKNLLYPNYELIVVDDGSTDGTAAIASKYPCRVIRTPNCGLSSARNTGLKEATGEIVAYVDDDAWPDPHWLTYLVHALLNTSQAGVGGPNIPPRGDGPVADCVANAPGGPIHVLLSDDVAEHIPGCNMAFRKSCLEDIGGFDTQFWAAGDDVDVCWRLQERGWTIGFHPGAMVWHHRRNSIGAYWRQQKGYGKAEALLERKWPQKYQAAGGITWAGRIYGKGKTVPIGSTGRIYHGTWGIAPFQSLYQRSPGLLRSLPLIPEWYLFLAILLLVSLLGFSWSPLGWTAWLLAAALTLTIVQAGFGASRAIFTTSPLPPATRWRLRMTTMLLYLLQPLARLFGRIPHGLTPWRHRAAVAALWPGSRTVKLWRECRREPDRILTALESALRNYQAVVRRGGDFDRWDLELGTGVMGRVRLLMGVEEHGGGKQLLRFRIWPKCSPATMVLGLACGMLSALAAFDGAIVASMVLALAPASLFLWMFRDCASAMAVCLHSLEKLWLQ